MAKYLQRDGVPQFLQMVQNHLDRQKVILLRGLTPWFQVFIVLSVKKTILLNILSIPTPDAFPTTSLEDVGQNTTADNLRPTSPTTNDQQSRFGTVASIQMCGWFR